MLFYKSVDDLKKLCSSDNMSAQIAELEGKAARGESDPRIVAAEPGNAAVSAKRFYLMPILGAPEEPFDGTKFLHVASIDPGKAGKKRTVTRPAQPAGTTARPRPASPLS